MLGNRNIRTGIDIGATSVKLVRGEGRERLERHTHVGIEEWTDPAPGRDPAAPAEALRRLLKRLGLKPRQLGRVAAAVDGPDASFREVAMPPLSDEELRQALPFEARRHLNVAGMTDPVLDAQILGPDPTPGDESVRALRVLLAAVPAAMRERPLNVLARLGLEPEVIDLAPLAALNTLLAQESADDDPDRALALLDLGRSQSGFHCTGSKGGLFSRQIAAGVPTNTDTEAMRGFVKTLAREIAETRTFYRGRHRREIRGIFLAGGGALSRDLITALAEEIDVAIDPIDPLAGFAGNVRGLAEARHQSPRFAVACGLARWWDGNHV